MKIKKITFCFKFNCEPKFNLSIEISSLLERRNFNKRWNNNQPFSTLFGPRIIRIITDITKIAGEFKPKKFINFKHSDFTLVHHKN